MMMNQTIRGLLAFALLAFHSPMTSDQNVEPTGVARSVTPTVLNQETGEPLRGASVSIRGERIAKSTAVTDDAGQLDILIVDGARSIQIDVKADGFVPLRGDRQRRLRSAGPQWRGGDDPDAESLQRYRVRYRPGDVHRAELSRGTPAMCNAIGK